jgi:aryl-alcohol dehydrogenase-like predicted oxidoreductase
MEYRQLGLTGMAVSRLCFGALTIGPLQAGLPLPEGARVIRAALEGGVNFIDTAELYGTYDYIREALKGYNREVIITSKSYAYTREGMQDSLERARRELDRDVVDIFLLHEQESIHTIRGHWSALEYLLEAKAKGKIRAIGISTHLVSGVEAATQVPEIEVVHPLYNIEGLGIGDGNREDMYRAIEAAHAAGKGVYSMKPLGGGNLLRRSDEALAYVLAQSAIDAVAMGMRTLEEVAMNLCLVEGNEVPSNVRTQVSQVKRSLHIEEWCEGCGKCVERCHTGALTIQDTKARVDREQCLLCGYCGSACPLFCIKVV